MTALNHKRSVVLALFLPVLVVILVACGSTETPQVTSSARSGTAISVGVATVTTGSISAEKAYAAVVEAENQVDLVPLATGRVTNLTADIGSEVKEGQVLAELSHGTLDPQLEQALAVMRDAQARLASAQTASEPKQVTAQAKLDAALAAQNQL